MKQEIADQNSKFFSCDFSVKVRECKVQKYGGKIYLWARNKRGVMLIEFCQSEKHLIEKYLL